MRKLLIVAMLVLFCAIPSHAQLWSGIIDPARAIDWTSAGLLPGGLPDAGWTQCGSTISAYSGTAATINTQISGCSANQFVLLGAGTFTLSTSIDFGHKSHVVLRGSGANSTFLVFTVATAPPSCNLGGRVIAGMCSSDTTCWAACGGQTVYNWTAGYAQGSNSITLSSVASIVPIGSGNPTLIFMTQDDDGYTGNPATGSSTDNGNYFLCADQYVAPHGCGVDGPDGVPGNSALTHNYQYEVGIATAVNSSTKVVTLLQPLKHPNWRTGQSPKVWIVQSAVQMGMENMSIDTNDVASVTLAAIGIEACYQCWVSGVRQMNFQASAVLVTLSSHYDVENNYLYGSIGSDSYGLRTGGINGDGLFQNNILQKVETPILFDGPDSGTVIGYNYTINNTSASDGLIQSYWDHSAGDDFHLWEGNIGTGFQIDIFHGTHLDETAFRNFSLGWDSCGNGQCGSATAKDSGTIAYILSAFNRYNNIIGNVLGTPGYHNTYLGPCTGNKCIYYKGIGDGSVPTDTLTASTAMFWSNYDVVNGSTQFNSAEVPTAAPVYPNAVPASHAIPNSFYLNSKPGWFGSNAYPPIHPDTGSGVLGQCSGPLNTVGQYSGLPSPTNAACGGHGLTAAAWSAHVDMNPAMACFLALGGVPDGTNSALSFNPVTCYGASVNPPPTLLIIGATQPSPAMTAPGGTIQFTVTCNPSPCGSVTWGTNIGTINSGTGVLTAPAVAGTGMVTAAVGTATASFPVNVIATQAAPVVTSFSATITVTNTFPVPQNQTCNCVFTLAANGNSYSKSCQPPCK